MQQFRLCVRVRGNGRECRLNSALRWLAVLRVVERAQPIRDLRCYLIPQGGKASSAVPTVLCFARCFVVHYEKVIRSIPAANWALRVR